MRFAQRLLAVLCVLLTAGCMMDPGGPPQPPGPDHGPPPPPDAAEMPVLITHTITASIDGEDYPGQVIVVVVTDLTDDGEYALMTATGVAAPDFIPSAVTTFEYEDLLMAGVVHSEIQATGIAMMKGSVLMCETETAEGDLVDRMQVEQLMDDFREISVVCRYAR